MEECRCKKCNKLLFKGKYRGIIEIICNRCKTIQTFVYIAKSKGDNAKKVRIEWQEHQSE